MRVLITGATGFVGSALTYHFLKNDIEVFYLTTSRNKIFNKPNCHGFYWNPKTNEIDPKCIEGVDYIFNLSGKSISCRWNSKNKKEILQSRINSSEVLFHLLSKSQHNVKKVISASAIGIYQNNFELIQTEESTNFNSNFLGEVCQLWEAENIKFNELGIETLIVRFGLVLSDKEGALPEFSNTIKKYIGSPLGSGKQWYSWIHIHDLLAILVFGMKENITGIVNAVAPNPEKQKDFILILANILKKPLFLPRIPTYVLKLILGEMHYLITDSQRIESDKLSKLGFVFKFPMLREAFKDLYKK